MDAGGSASDRLVGVPRASTIGRCVPPNYRGGFTGATAADSCRYDAHGRVKSERWEPRDRTPNPRTKRERVSRSRCAELRKHAQHESPGAHRFHLCYTITRHKTCHVSGGYISAAIRARSTSSRAVTAPACAGCRGHLDRLDDPAGGGAAQRGPVWWENWATGRSSRTCQNTCGTPDRPVPAARGPRRLARSPVSNRTDLAYEELVRALSRRSKPAALRSVRRRWRSG